MADTFLCPHCGAVYPRKPALVGRNVRCTSCKQAFQLQENGNAIKISGRNDSARRQAKDEDTRRQFKERMRTTNEREKEERLKREEREKAAESKRLRLRQAMAATLNKSASEALEVEASKVETERHQRRRDDKNKKVKDYNSISKLEVVLTGQSVEQHKQQRVMLFGCGGMLLLSAIFIWFIASSSETQRALNYFAELPKEEDRNYPSRHLQYLNKMWYHSLEKGKAVPIVVDVNDAELLGKPEVIVVKNAPDFFKKFGNLVHMHTEEQWKATEEEEAERQELADEEPESYAGSRMTPDLWVEKGAEELARSLWWDDGGRLRSELMLKGRINLAGKEAYLTKSIPAWAEREISEPIAGRILGTLFIANSDDEGSKRWQEDILNGLMPRQIEIQRFRGVGTVLRDLDESYSMQFNVAYTGILMRCDIIGEPDPGGNRWRIFEVRSE